MNLYTVSEVSKILRVKKSFVYELIYSMRLKAIKLSERRIRISSVALEEFINGKNSTELEGKTEAAGK